MDRTARSEHRHSDPHSPRSNKLSGLLSKKRGGCQLMATTLLVNSYRNLSQHPQRNDARGRYETHVGPRP